MLCYVNEENKVLRCGPIIHDYFTATAERFVANFYHCEVWARNHFRKKMCDMSLPSKRHLDRFSHFNMAYPYA